MGLFNSKSDLKSAEEMEVIKKNVEEMIRDNKIVVFSKSYCPYCTKAKQALSKEVVDYLVVELNGHPEGSAIQEILGKMTGGSSVPRVFVNGKFIGGGDDTDKLQRNGQLKIIIQQA